VAGCASAKVDNGNNSDGNTGGDDAGNSDAKQPPDAAIDSPPDAPIAVTLQQTGATNLVATQVGCQQINPATGFTNENSYYRTYPLSDFGITVPFHIVDVTFAVERSTAGNGVSQPATVRLGTYGGGLNATTFAVAALTPLAAANIQIPQNATSVTVPISMFTPSTLTVQPGVILYAEVFVPDGTAQGNIFYIGSNNGTETHPSYIRAPTCGVASPTRYATAVTSNVIRLLLTVNGTH
jgi:hypothetical protein